MSVKEDVEQRVIGRRIVRILWDDVDDFGRPVDERWPSLHGIVLDDGTTVALSASGQIDVQRVWVSVEKS